MEPKAGDVIFVDTNILLTATDRQQKHHQDAQRVISKASGAGLHLALSGQILREYLVVATRSPSANGLGMSTVDALTNVKEFLRHTILYEETEAVSVRLRGLVVACGLTGTRIHDGNVAATMLAHGLTFLLSLKAGDFAKIPGLCLLDVETLSRRLGDELSS